MCISRSVGIGGHNQRDDVKTIQALLNLSLDRLPPRDVLSVDGLIGSKTISAIEDFQTHVVGMQRADGRAHPGGATAAHLLDPVPPAFTEQSLQIIMPNALKANIQRFFIPLRDKMQDHEIDTPLRHAHFLAQIGHESAEFTYTEEIASGAAYEGRADLGNTRPGDGVRFKGRGLIQLTGRANYVAYGNAIGVDLTKDDNAKLVATDPDLAVDVACWFWKQKKLNRWADEDNIRKVTKTINGGYNGFDHRSQLLVRSRALLLR